MIKSLGGRAIGRGYFSPFYLLSFFLDFTVVIKVFSFFIVLNDDRVQYFADRHE